MLDAPGGASMNDPDAPDAVERPLPSDAPAHTVARTGAQAVAALPAGAAAVADVRVLPGSGADIQAAPTAGAKPDRG